MNNQHETVQLLCPASRTTHCGAMVSRSSPMQVYNLETDKKHTFFAGSEKIFVHNCDTPSYLFAPLHNHIVYNAEREHEIMEESDRALYEMGRKRLCKYSAAQLLSTVDGEREISGNIAYYAMTGVYDSDSPPGVLFKDTGKSKSINESLKALSSEEVVGIMQQAPEYAEAETVVIINDAPVEEEGAVSRGFTEYFQAIGTLSGKKVVYNRRNSLSLYTFAPDNTSALTRVVGFQDDPSGSVLFPFTFNQFVLVHPAK